MTQARRSHQSIAAALRDIKTAQGPAPEFKQSFIAEPLLYWVYKANRPRGKRSAALQAAAQIVFSAATDSAQRSIRPLKA